MLCNAIENRQAVVVVVVVVVAVAFFVDVWRNTQFGRQSNRGNLFGLMICRLLLVWGKRDIS